MALMPTRQNGPAARSFAADAHDCIMVGSNHPTEYKSVARRCAPNGELPSDPQAPPPEAMQKARLAVHRRSACSGVKALRNTSVARRQAAKLGYRFGPLTPCARSANLIAGDGTKNGFPTPNKELTINQKQPLDIKSPIQVRVLFPPAIESDLRERIPRSGIRVSASRRIGSISKRIEIWRCSGQSRWRIL